MKKRIQLLMLTAMMVFFAVNVIGQGATTSGINGIVTDASNQPLPGANVVAIHVPSGTQYGTITSDIGQFSIPYVRSGGPYKISVSFLGYKNQVIEDVNLSLGEDRDLNFTLQVADENLGEVIVTAKTNKTFNAGRTGADNNISNEQISTIPSLSRSLSDMTRLTPQSSGLNFMGRNSLYNNLSIDGSVFNNSFGLASTPGGQTNAQPISLDAIEEIQVSMAPYDVRQSGFTGAGINAITRSGTNEFKGSVYYFFRNENLVSKEIAGKEVSADNFNQKQMGFRVGGPIIKNKLFFFVNGEIERRDDPAHNFLAGRPGLTGDNVSNVQAFQLDSLRSVLISKYGYDPGEYEKYKMNTTNDKFLVRLDYNLGSKHKLSLRYNYLKSYKDNNPSGITSGLNTMVFSNNMYGIYNNINSVIGEVNSTISDKISNNFIIGWTGFRDYRTSPSDKFPMVEIRNAGITWTTFGYEQYSAKNILNTDVFQVSNNLTYRMGKHTITAGASYEGFKFENSFIRQYYGYYRFGSLANFYNSSNGDPLATVARYQYQQSAIPGDPEPLAKLNSAQLGIYLQDEWKVSPRLKITYGLRVDFPFYPSSLLKNPELDTMSFQAANGGQEIIDVSVLPKAKPLFAPRVGFNYDVFGERKTQLRGGFGIFTGRIPFVWISNQASNNGMMWNRIDALANNTIYQFNPDVNAYAGSLASVSSYEINATVKDFKFPQVMRLNLAVDQKLPLDFVLTLEGIYTKDLNAVYHRNSNLPIGNATILAQDGRYVFPANAGPISGNRINQKVSASYILDNTSEGYSYFLTTQLQKNFKFGLNMMAAYTYSKTKDLSSNPGSTASSAFGFNSIAINPNDPDLTYSLFDQPHKLVGSINYSIEFLKHLKTTASIVYVGSQSGRYSYVYAGDINRDGASTDNDLIYVPKDFTDIELIVQQTPAGYTGTDTRTSGEIWTQLDAFISKDPYLNDNRGKIVPRNGGILPWTHQFDFRLVQEIFTNVSKSRQSLEFTLDIINFGNLLNSNWGVYKYATNAKFLQFRDFNGTNGAPRYSFPYEDFTNKVPYTEPLKNSTGISSRWQIQIGLRYNFN